MSCPRSYRTGVRTLISVTTNSIFFPLERSWIWTARHIGRHQFILLDSCWVGNETFINLNIIPCRLVPSFVSSPVFGHLYPGSYCLAWIVTCEMELNLPCTPSGQWCPASSSAVIFHSFYMLQILPFMKVSGLFTYCTLILFLLDYSSCMCVCACLCNHCHCL